MSCGYCNCVPCTKLRGANEIEDSDEDKIASLEQRLSAAEARIAEAQKIIAHGVQLMPLAQLSKWEGVRAWQEDEP